MELKDQKFKEIIDKGYQVRFFKEERYYPMTGKYTALCITLEKEGVEIMKNFSRKSYEEALDITFNMLKFNEEVFWKKE